jgi:hypothetical protein
VRNIPTTNPHKLSAERVAKVTKKLIKRLVQKGVLQPTAEPTPQPGAPVAPTARRVDSGRQSSAMLEPRLAAIDGGKSESPPDAVLDSPVNRPGRPKS